MTRVLLTVVVLAGILAAAAVPAGARGCPATACMPKTGTYGGPSPQGLRSSFGSTAVSFTVAYVKAGAKTKSAYGNTVTNAGVYARYTCPNPGTPWVEVGAAFFPGQATIGRNGKGRLVVPASGNAGTHTWTFKFTRDHLTGHVAGTYKASDGSLCRLSTDFAAKLKT